MKKAGKPAERHLPQRRTQKSRGHALLGLQRTMKREAAVEGASQAVAVCLLRVVTDRPAGASRTCSGPRRQGRIRLYRV